MDKALKVGLIVGCALLVIGLSSVGFYAFQQKKRAKKAIALNNPFGTVFLTIICLQAIFFAIKYSPCFLFIISCDS